MVMVGRDEVLAAAARIGGVVEETPLVAARLGRPFFDLDAEMDRYFIDGWRSARLVNKLVGCAPHQEM